MLDKLLHAWKRIRNSRLYRRLNTELAVRLTPEHGDFASSTITNWSPGGVFVRTEAKYPLYSKVELEFKLGTSGDSSLKLKGQVVRQDATGIGIMFTDFTESGLMVLRDFLAKESTRITQGS